MHLHTNVLVCMLAYTTFEVFVRADDEMNFNADDMVKQLKGAMDTLFDYVGDKNGCFYKCPEGRKPIPRVGHVPSTNGCGSFGMQIDTSSLPGVGKCCDQHDYCYDTCNKVKEKCDDEFRVCLNKMCTAAKETVSKNILEGCKTSVDIMFMATMTAGCKPYKDAQKDACVCQKVNSEL